MDIGDEGATVEDPVIDAVRGTVVLDPGHGGGTEIGGSSANNAISPSGVREKVMTLELANAVSAELKTLASRTPGSRINVHLTRAGDSNLGLADRAGLAASKKADIFLSIHYNAYNGRVRGTETWILSEPDGNVNFAEDKAFAQRVQAGMVAALRSHDPGTRDRGVKHSQLLSVLKDIHLGNSRTEHPTRACLIEVEFIDVDAVDALLNTGPDAKSVRTDVARSIAEAIFDDLQANA